MFKNAIAPIQAWLMSQGKCVGDGKLLENKKRTTRKDGSEMVTCTCGRIYIYDTKAKNYRRALLEEV